MDDRESLNITVLIAGRPYPLKIKTSDEAIIRKLVKEINDKINSFQSAYAQKDKQDCLSMALLTYAVELQKKRQSAGMDKSVSDKILAIDSLLSSALSEG